MTATTVIGDDPGTLSWTNGTGSAVSSGDVVEVGNLLAVALSDIAAAATGIVATRGVFTVPKVSAAVVSLGESLVWKHGAKAFDDNQAAVSAGDFTGAGFSAAGSAVALIDSMRVRFSGMPCTKN